MKRYLFVWLQQARVFMKPITLVAIAIGLFAALETAAQEELPVKVVITAVKAQARQQCSLGLERMSSRTHPFEKQQASALERMNCDCLPAEIDRAALDLSGGKESATITQVAFLSRLKIAVNACAVQLVQADVAAACQGENKSVLGVTDKKAYYGCQPEKLNALDYDTIAQDATTKYKNIQNKVYARMNDEAEPVPIPTLLDGIEKVCKQAGT